MKEIFTRGLYSCKHAYRLAAMMDIISILRAALRDSATSRYRLSKDTGISQAQLSRFVRSKAGMDLPNAQRLADALGLEIIIRPKRRKGR